MEDTRHRNLAFRALVMGEVIGICGVLFVLGSFFFLVFLGLPPWHMQVPRLGVESELQLPAYAKAAATATRDSSRIFDLHHSSQQCQILSPLSKGQGLNPHPLGYKLDLFPLHLNRSSRDGHLK